MAGTALPYFLYSAGILFREGLEALLVVIALAAGVRQMGAPRKARGIYAGALIAVAVSIVLACVVSRVLADNTSDAIEGCFQLLAAATLFYVSSWLTGKAQAAQWSRFISARLESAERSAMPAFALGLTAFLAVMREGAETIVFFQALAAGATEVAEKHAVAAGIVVAAVALAIVFVALRNAAARIPLGIFFSSTSVLLYALAVVFVGQGIASLQEAEVVRATFVNHVPTLQVLGIFPTVQSLVAQGLLLVLALADFFRPRGSVVAAVEADERSEERSAQRRVAPAN
jgi:high-affinity iron transporter